MLVKFCENNLSHGTDDVMERLKSEMDNITVEVEPCLGHCGECAEGPFALVNDVFIQADTPEDLYDEIVEQL